MTFSQIYSIGYPFFEKEHLVRGLVRVWGGEIA